MKTCKHLTYTRKIQWRIRALWLLLTGMLVYMVLIAELGGGDSRMMTPLADKFYSKSNPLKEKSIEQIRKSMSKYGEASVARFERWYHLFLL